MEKKKGTGWGRKVTRKKQILPEKRGLNLSVSGEKPSVLLATVKKAVIRTSEGGGEGKKRKKKRVAERWE